MAQTSYLYGIKCYESPKQSESDIQFMLKNAVDDSFEELLSEETYYSTRKERNDMFKKLQQYSVPNEYCRVEKVIMNERTETTRKEKT